MIRSRLEGISAVNLHISVSCPDPIVPFGQQHEFNCIFISSFRNTTPDTISAKMVIIIAEFDQHYSGGEKVIKIPVGNSGAQSIKHEFSFIPSKGQRSIRIEGQILSESEPSLVINKTYAWCNFLVE